MLQLVVLSQKEAFYMGRLGTFGENTVADFDATFPISSLIATTNYSLF